MESTQFPSVNLSPGLQEMTAVRVETPYGTSVAGLNDSRVPSVGTFPAMVGGFDTVSERVYSSASEGVQALPQSTVVTQPKEPASPNSTITWNSTLKSAS